MKKAFVVTLCVLLSGTVAFADWDPGDEHKMHYPQLPDLNGWDVAVYGGFVADDWKCSATGPVNDIHIWGSWQGDLGDNNPPKPVFTLQIYSNHPEPPGPFSQPDQLLWTGRFEPRHYESRPYGEGPQGWFDPFLNEGTANDHDNVYQYNFESIVDPFFQTEGEIYWLALTVDHEFREFFGWKTTSVADFEDYAVWRGDRWNPLLISGEPHVDMAFVITPIPGAVWLLGSGLVGLVGIRRKFRK